MGKNEKGKFLSFFTNQKPKLKHHIFFNTSFLLFLYHKLSDLGQHTAYFLTVLENRSLKCVC